MLGVCSSSSSGSSSNSSSEATKTASQEDQTACEHKVIRMLSDKAKEGNLLDYLCIYRLIPATHLSPAILVHQYHECFLFIPVRGLVCSMEICFNCFDVELIDFAEVEEALQRMALTSTFSVEEAENAVELYYGVIRAKIDGEYTASLGLETFLSGNGRSKKYISPAITCGGILLIAGLGLFFM